MKLFRTFLFIMATAVYAASFSCQSNEASLSGAEKKEYRKQGMQVIQATFKTLSGEVMQAMKRGGVEEAIPYCQLSAYPLTDSIARTQGVQLKRAAVRYRNPDNKATDKEAEIYSRYQEQLQQGESPGPVVERYEGVVSMYAPIVLQGQCVSCHGTVGEGIATENYEIIKAKYPNDKAINFAPGDLRGIWHVTFNN